MCVILQDGSNSILTNYCKIALLPTPVYNTAIAVCESYEKGELFPPVSAKQRQRKNVSSSSFNFLRGLNPQNPQDQNVIHEKLSGWISTKQRPALNKASLWFICLLSFIVIFDVLDIYFFLYLSFEITYRKKWITTKSRVIMT